MSHGSIASAESDPQLSALLTDQHRRFLEETFPAWGGKQVSALSRQRANGSLSALLWERAGTGAIGIVWLQALQTGARIHGVWTDPVGSESLRALMEDIEREEEVGPIAAVTDVLPGLDGEQQSRFFEPKGFWHRAKVLMRRASEGAVLTPSRSSKVRPIELADLKTIVGIYVRAYSARPGEFWTWGSPDAWADAVRDVMSHADGTSGWTPKFLPEASFVWDDNGALPGFGWVKSADLEGRGRRVGVPWARLSHRQWTRGLDCGPRVARRAPSWASSPK